MPQPPFMSTQEKLSRAVLNRTYASTAGTTKYLLRHPNPTLVEVELLGVPHVSTPMLVGSGTA